MSDNSNNSSNKINEMLGNSDSIKQIAEAVCNMLAEKQNSGQNALSASQAVQNNSNTVSDPNGISESKMRLAEYERAVNNGSSGVSGVSTGLNNSNNSNNSNNLNSSSNVNNLPNDLIGLINSFSQTQVGNTNDNRITLLRAIRPFLSDAKKEKLDCVIKALSVTSLLSGLRD